MESNIQQEKICAGMIYSEERAQLSTETVEKLVYIKENIHLLPKEIEELSKLIQNLK